MSFPSFKQNNGFTLIEMLISVAILSIITGIGVINLTNYKNRHSFELDTKNVLEATRNAENKSILGDQGTGWGIKFTSNVDNGYFEIFSGTSYATSSVVVTQYLSSASRFSNPPPGFSKTIVFGQITGVPDASQMIALKTVTGSDSSITSLGVRGTLNQLPGKDLVGYWPMDEGLGTTAYDASGKSHNGTLQSSLMWQTVSSCRSGQCLSFDGNTNYVDIGTVGGYSNNLSVSAWVYHTNAAGWDDIVAGSCGDLLFAFSGSTFAFGGQCNSPFGMTSYLSNIDNAWHFVAATYNGQVVTLFVDGVSVGSSSQTGSFNPRGLFIGGGTNERFSGFIDDVRIYDRALTATEVKTLYESY